MTNVFIRQNEIHLKVLSKNRIIGISYKIVWKSGITFLEKNIVSDCITGDREKEGYVDITETDPVGT